MEECMSWILTQQVPLNKTVKVVKIGFMGADCTKLPLRESGYITMRHLRDIYKTHFFSDNGLDDKPDEKAIMLPTITILENGEAVTYRAPLLMTRFLADIASGMIVAKSAQMYSKKDMGLIPFEMRLFNKPVDDKIALDPKLIRLLNLSEREVNNLQRY